MCRLNYFRQIYVNGGDSVYLTMPLTGFQTNIKQYTFDVRVKFLHENGLTTEFTYNYTFVSDQPDINIDYKEVAALPTIDMKDAKNMSGFVLTNRKGNTDGRVKEMKVELSDDGNNWNNAGSYTFESTDLGQQKTFTQTYNRRFIRLTITSVHNSATVPNPQYASMAEFGVY